MMESVTALASAAPSIVCLIPLIFLPRNARKSLSIWRALQAYDVQGRSSTTPETLATSKATKGFNVVPSLIMLAFFFTSGVKIPWVAFVRSVFPNFIYYIVLFGVSTVVIDLACSTPSATSVSRRWNAVLKKYDAISVDSNRLSATVVTICAITALVVVYTSRFVIPDSIPYITAGAGAIVWSSATWHPPTYHNHLTFHGMLLLPVLLAIFTTALLLVISAITFAVLLFAAKTSKIANGSDGKIGEHTVGFGTDLFSEQVLAIYYPFIWSSHIYFGAALALLAYRYDASHADLTRVTEEDAQRILADSQMQPPKTPDVLGRRAIRVDCAAVPCFALPRRELPTFYAAFFTMLTVQILGVAIDYLTAWQPRVVFPLTVQEIAKLNMAFSAWPLLAYPLALSAMLLCVSLHPHRSFESLWKYGEDWRVKYEPEQMHALEEVMDSKA